MQAHAIPLYAGAGPRWSSPNSTASGGVGVGRVATRSVVLFPGQPPFGCRCGVPVVIGRRRFRFRRVVAIATSGGEESQEPMSTAQQIALVVHTLGFGKRQLAEIFGVSRQAIYDGLRGGNVRDENADRLETLARLVLVVSGDTRRPLYHRFTSRPLAEGEASLLDLLRADRWDETRILAQLRRARTLTTQRQGRRGKESSPISGSRRDEYLADNLLWLGER